MPLQLVASGDSSGSTANDLIGLFYLVFIIWAIVIVGHIIRHALEIRMVSGIVIALGYFLIANYIIQSLFTVG